jgi:hypothetical protein
MPAIRVAQNGNLPFNDRRRCGMGTTVEFENERVKVLRIKHGPRERHPQTSRKDRLVIYLTDGHVRRTESGKHEELTRKAGEVVWRDRSQHHVENLKDAHQEVIVVELKK